MQKTTIFFHSIEIPSIEELQTSNNHKWYLKKLFKRAPQLSN